MPTDHPTGSIRQYHWPTRKVLAAWFNERATSIPMPIAESSAKSPRYQGKCCLWFLLLACLGLQFSFGETSRAQAPAVEWMRTAGGVNQDSGNGIALDAEGNIVITGFFNGAARSGIRISSAAEISTSSCRSSMALGIASGPSRRVDRAVTFAGALLRIKTGTLSFPVPSSAAR